ncbi:MAG: hypothetical protein PHF79_02875 [Candidatus Pacebacteria bacterium]|nr:hypothetical protein [Candidatus Paceibacterota bacterium]
MNLKENESDDVKSTGDLIKSQKRIFNDLKSTMEEQQQVQMLINYFILGLFLVVVMYFFVV